MAVAIACDKREEFFNTTFKRQLNRQDLFCACFEASDSSGNAQRELSCFRREQPKCVVVSPTNNTTFYSWTIADGVRARASVSSGLALRECRWEIYRPRERKVSR